jgi:hypothetical protein
MIMTQKAQQIVEYLLLFTVIIVIILFVSGGIGVSTRAILDSGLEEFIERPLPSTPRSGVIDYPE